MARHQLSIRTVVTVWLFEVVTLNPVRGARPEPVKESLALWVLGV